MVLKYTAKNKQVVASLLTSCNNLLQQADIKMGSHTRAKIYQVDAMLFAEQRLNNVVFKVQQQLLNSQ